MAYMLRSVLIVGMAVVGWAALGASVGSAQTSQEPAVRHTGTMSNLFETLDPTRPIDALRITLPDRWALEGARLLRYGTEPVSLRIRDAKQPGAHLLVTETPVRGPHDLVVRVRMPDLPGTDEWTLQLLVREAAQTDSAARARFRSVERRRHRVAVEAPSPPDRANHALSLAEATEPLRLRADALPPLGQMSPFTIEFWVQTNGLDEVVLSTWNGNESVAYPAEFVVDQGGRLRFYSGQPGQHQALRTGRPIADGEWHHVAVVYDARTPRLRLILDGQPADLHRGSVSPTPGPVPLAVGGRIGPSQHSGTERRSLFSGRIDELRIWGEARSIEALRQFKNRPYRASPDDAADRFVRLGFDAEQASSERAAPTEPWPEGARRVPTALSFRSSLRNLQARTEGRAVTLQWEAADADDIERFVVERSTGQQAFTPVATLTPEEAEQSPTAEAPAFAYTDKQVRGQIVFYRIRLRRADSTERTSGVIKIGLGPESEKQRPVTLLGNFPNPFSESTTVAYEVNEPEPVTITVWDLQGHKIAELADGTQDPGYHEVAFDAAELPSGNYFVRLETPNGTQSRKMVVLK